MGRQDRQGNPLSPFWQWTQLPTHLWPSQLCLTCSLSSNSSAKPEILENAFVLWEHSWKNGGKTAMQQSQLNWKDCRCLVLFSLFKKYFFLTQHSYFPCLYLVIQWYLLCASLSKTLSLSHSHSEKQPGLLSQWYHFPTLCGCIPGLFLHTVPLFVTVQIIICQLWLGCITCCIQCTLRLGTFLKVLVQPDKAALWLRKCFGLCNAWGLGLSQNRFFTMVPFDLSAD